MIKSATNSHRWEDGKNVTDFKTYTKKQDAAYPQTSWINVLQNDFAARADWCVNNYAKANHAPVVTLKGLKNISAKPGALIKLSGFAKDPDGNAVSFNWWQYEEVGTYAGIIKIQHADKKEASFKASLVAKVGNTIHIILEGKDNGKPELTRYQRVILTVK